MCDLKSGGRDLLVETSVCYIVGPSLCSPKVRVFPAAVDRSMLLHYSLAPSQNP
jgi:hypothetical protein